MNRVELSIAEVTGFLRFSTLLNRLCDQPFSDEAANKIGRFFFPVDGFLVDEWFDPWPPLNRRRELQSMDALAAEDACTFWFNIALRFVGAHPQQSILPSLVLGYLPVYRFNKDSGRYDEKIGREMSFGDLMVSFLDRSDLLAYFEKIFKITGVRISVDLAPQHDDGTGAIVECLLAADPKIKELWSEVVTKVGISDKKGDNRDKRLKAALEYFDLKGNEYWFPMTREMIDEDLFPSCANPRRDFKDRLRPKLVSASGLGDYTAFRLKTILSSTLSVKQ